jgi:magnesium-transporting ATPase (P-type)
MYLVLVVFLFLATRASYSYSKKLSPHIRSSGGPMSTNENVVDERKTRRVVCLSSLKGGHQSQTHSVPATPDSKTLVQVASNLTPQYIKNFFQAAHALSVTDCLDGLISNEKTGLFHADANYRRSILGRNVLEGNSGKPFWRLILEQFQDRLVQILLSVAILSAVLAAFENESHAYTEPCVIFSVIFINAVVGIWQSRSAENSLEALKRLQPATVGHGI